MMNTKRDLLSLPVSSNDIVQQQKLTYLSVENLDYIEKLNARNDGATYGVTQFADLTNQEFKEQYLMNDVPPLVQNGRVASLINNATLPTSFDWATHSPPVVTPVYNQVYNPFITKYFLIRLKLGPMWFLLGLLGYREHRIPLGTCWASFGFPCHAADCVL